jgi:opacity protein-like surface antigen
MKQKKIKGLLVLLFALAVFSSKAQQAVTTAGGDAAGIGGTVVWSVGQVVFTTNVSANYSIAQGVQHPHEISITPGTQSGGFNFSLLVYPNPTNDFVTLQLKYYNNENLTYQLFDAAGRLLISNKITSSKTNIGMGHLAAAPYLLKIISDNETVQTFKLIKN